MQQKPSSRRQQLLRQLSSVSGYKGIDSLSDLTIREQIEWILQRTNPRLRLAIATLVHAGERSSCSKPDPTRNPPTPNTRRNARRSPTNSELIGGVVPSSPAPRHASARLEGRSDRAVPGVWNCVA